MGAFLVVVFMPIFQFFLAVRKSREPVRVEAFDSEPAIEGFHDGFVGRLPLPERRRTLRPVDKPTDPSRATQTRCPGLPVSLKGASYLPANPFEHLHDIDAAECEARFKARRESYRRW